MTLSFEQLLVLFTALVGLFSPAASIGPFASLVGHLPRDEQRKVARGVFINVVVVLLIFVWMGEVIFRILGVTPHTLTIVGGIALFHSAMPMMFVGNKEKAHRDESTEEEPQGWRALVAVPMTFPMSIDGTFAAYMVSAAAIGQTTVDLVAISVVVVLFGVVVWLTHYLSPPLAARLDPAGLDILTRIGGIVLLAIAVGLFADGIKGLFPILAGS